VGGVKNEAGVYEQTIKITAPRIQLVWHLLLGPVDPGLL
jgi:hypothetical protein